MFEKNGISLIMCFTMFILFTDSALSIKVECNIFQWKCDNTECISNEDLCDGVAQCIDGSDEIAENCIHNSYLCPAYAFRCSYGACIRGNSKCNGVRECFDGSDELPALCAENKTEIEIMFRGNCSDNQFQCDLNQCIEKENICDGIFNCKDHSDESLEICSTIECPEYSFRCAYGGCISGISKCNGIEECHDGSDEAHVLCEEQSYNHQTILATTETYVTNTSPSLSKPPISFIPTPPTSYNQNMAQGCILPLDRKHLVARNAKTEVLLNLGTLVPNGTIVNFSCGHKTIINGYTNNQCENSKWSSRIPYCENVCSSFTLERGLSTNTICYYDDHMVSCHDPIFPKTKAIISCATGYSFPENQELQTIINCDDDGEWDYPKFRCLPQCGVSAYKPFDNNVMPWDIIIFIRSFEAIFYPKCKGTIISPKIVLTATACFLTNPLGEANDISFYKVIEGNSQNPFKESEIITFNSYVHNVARINLPPHFKLGAAWSYSDDIALVVIVDFFKFSTTVQPICLQLRQTENYENVSKNNSLLGSISSYRFESRNNKVFLKSILGKKFTNGKVKQIEILLFKKFIETNIEKYYTYL